MKKKKQKKDYNKVREMVTIGEKAYPYFKKRIKRLGVAKSEYIRSLIVADLLENYRDFQKKYGEYYE